MSIENDPRAPEGVRSPKAGPPMTAAMGDPESEHPDALLVADRQAVSKTLERELCVWRARFSTPAICERELADVRGEVATLIRHIGLLLDERSGNRERIATLERDLAAMTEHLEQQLTDSEAELAALRAQLEGRTA